MLICGMGYLVTNLLLDQHYVWPSPLPSIPEHANDMLSNRLTSMKELEEDINQGCFFKIKILSLNQIMILKMLDLLLGIVQFHQGVMLVKESCWGRDDTTPRSSQPRRIRRSSLLQEQQGLLHEVIKTQKSLETKTSLLERSCWTLRKSQFVQHLPRVVVKAQNKNERVTSELSVSKVVKLYVIVVYCCLLLF